MAKAPAGRLVACIQPVLVDVPAISILRRRKLDWPWCAGGTGQSFNLGEMTIARCVVQMEGPEPGQPIAGFGYVAGRSLQHAAFLLQRGARHQSDSGTPTHFGHFQRRSWRSETGAEV
ncbi:MAG: phosphonate C-P lyase system protein PhnG [Cyanobacteria bacterium J06642_2]